MNLVRLRNRRKERGFTQAEFASKIGVSASSYISWEQGKRGMNTSQLQMVAQALGVSADYLLDLSDDETLDEEVMEPDPQRDKLLYNYEALNEDGRERLVTYSQDLRVIPRYKATEDGTMVEVSPLLEDPKIAYINRYGYAAAGVGALNEDDEDQVPLAVEDDDPDDEDDDGEELDALDTGDLLPLVIIGESMAPAYPEGDIVWARRDCDHISGQVYIVRIGDELVVKRCYFGEEGLRLASDNPGWKDRWITGHDLEDVEIIGQVEAVTKTIG
ncbi:MAG: S24 family peptidase [Bacillota bacterium]|nr:S24 family peptidase [Bacillota bacterium]